MTLVDRVSAFFLAALALVLVASSGAYYWFVSREMYLQFDRRLFAALNPLVAAIEAEPDSVKWQPAEHAIELDQAAGVGGIRWAVTDDSGLVVEHSRGLRPESDEGRSFLRVAVQTPLDAEPRNVDRWRAVRRRVTTLEPPPDYHLEADDVGSPREPDEYDALAVTVGGQPAELNANLRRLRWLAVMLPAAAWAAAALAGRWFCSRAIAPVRTMASEARSMTAADFGRRLAVGDANDELGDLGVAFNKLLDCLEGAFHQQERFTGDAAHQLRTPLTVLLGQIDVALRHDRPGDEYRRTLGVLREQAIEMRQIVESLLFLARSDGAGGLPDREVVPLERWLLKYFERWERHPQRSDLRLEVNDAATASASPALLGQLVDNLVGNALKYSDPGTPVTVSLNRSDGRAVISIQDRGPGISPAEGNAIFEPFVRTADAKRRGVAGTGLGLAIATRIARALGGELTYASAVGAGSVFTFSLPAKDAAAEE